MNPIVYTIANGQSFFIGIALLLLAALAALQSRALVKRSATMAFLLGMIAVVVSSTTFPNWWYALAVVVTVAWIAACFRRRRQREMSYAFAGTWLLATGLELPYHLLPTITPASSRAVTILGDSVTAGIGGDEKSETWPKILAREHGVDVQDLSHFGETAASALKRAKKHEINAPIIFLEIGGNDLLGSTSAEKFGVDLDALLQHLAAPNRQLVMFELPLPPFNHEYGRVQRMIAAKHRAKLIPKRVFLAVLADRAATLDTIHLSQAGHQRMADCVWAIVQPTFAEVERSKGVGK